MRFRPNAFSDLFYLISTIVVKCFYTVTLRVTEWRSDTQQNIIVVRNYVLFLHSLQVNNSYTGGGCAPSVASRVTLQNTREKQKRRISCNTERAQNQGGGAWNTHPIARHGVTNRDTMKMHCREGNSITKCYRVFILGERIVRRSCSRFGNPRSDVAFCDSLFRGVR